MICNQHYSLGLTILSWEAWDRELNLTFTVPVKDPMPLAGQLLTKHFFNPVQTMSTICKEPHFHTLAISVLTIYRPTPYA